MRLQSARGQWRFRRGVLPLSISVRDEPGPGGVRVGATRTDLDCRVVATSRRVAPTECDRRLPLFGRGSTCRLRLLDSWSPRAEAVVFDSSRGSTRVSRPVAPTESDSSDIYVARGGWPNSSDSSDSVGLCRTKMSRHTRLVLHYPLTRPTSGTSTVQGRCRLCPGVGATRADGSTRLIHVRKATLHARQGRDGSRTNSGTRDASSTGPGGLAHLPYRKVTYAERLHSHLILSYESWVII